MAPAGQHGVNKAKDNGNLSLGDLVLVKVEDNPGWPAKISRPEDWEKTPDPEKYFVQFFGSKEIAFVAPADIEAFTSKDKNRLSAQLLGKQMCFAIAAKEICTAFDEMQKQKASGYTNDIDDSRIDSEAASNDGVVGNLKDATDAVVSNAKKDNIDKSATLEGSPSLPLDSPPPAPPLRSSPPPPPMLQPPPSPLPPSVVKNEVFPQQSAFAPTAGCSSQEPSKCGQSMYLNVQVPQPNHQFQQGNRPFAQRRAHSAPPQNPPNPNSYPNPTVQQHLPHSFHPPFPLPSLPDDWRQFVADEQWRGRNPACRGPPYGQGHGVPRMMRPHPYAAQSNRGTQTMRPHPYAAQSGQGHGMMRPHPYAAQSDQGSLFRSRGNRNGSRYSGRCQICYEMGHEACDCYYEMTDPYMSVFSWLLLDLYPY
ncbi:ENHANCER OF AG-4 protein 2 [Spatholobus suberectus]|nr:ENHANCER OF AG-4 protein 2 [Spatholobus suberectus]